MAGQRVKLVVQRREQLGSRESRRLRKQGVIPGVLYGRTDPVAIAVSNRELRRVLTGRSGLHAILDVVVEGDGDGATHPSILKAHQEDPVRGGLVHVDLHEVRLDRPIQSQVTVSLIGEAAGSKEGGVLSQVAREVTVEALPTEMPEHLDLDVSEMRIGDTLRVADIAGVADATILDDPETVIATVTVPTRVEEPEEVVEEEEGVEGLPEGEAPEGGAEAPSESEGEAGTGPDGEPGTSPG
jgi:large subunit ribosomal protein L25